MRWTRFFGALCGVSSLVEGAFTESGSVIRSEDSNVDRIFLACHVYALQRGVDIRHGQTGVANAELMDQLIWQGHRTAALQHARLARRYNGVKIPLSAPRFDNTGKVRRSAAAVLERPGSLLASQVYPRES